LDEPNGDEVDRDEEIVIGSDVGFSYPKKIEK
jgi:hypothetical protein